jgi:hypothetical protein
MTATVLSPGYSGENGQQKDALRNAIIQCGIDYVKREYPYRDPDSYSCYVWMENTTKTDQASQLVNKLNEMGFEIKPIKHSSKSKQTI